MTREQAIELLKQYTLAQIIVAVQAAYEQGRKAGLAQAADMCDDIPF